MKTNFGRKLGQNKDGSGVQSRAVATHREEPPVSDSEWYDRPGGHEEIAAVLRYLDENVGLTVADAIAIVEKPWHSDDAYDAMLLDRARELADDDMVDAHRDMRMWA